MALLAIHSSNSSNRYDAGGRGAWDDRLGGEIDPMRKSLRYLRIAFSIACLIACALLIVMWVRSYRLIERVDVIIGVEDADTNGIGPDTNSISLISVCGRSTLDVTYVSTDGEPGIYYNSYPPDPEVEYLGIGRVLFMTKPQPGWLISVPYWLSMSFIAALAVAPWLRWRFSLRTMLFATTIVAVALGTIVWFYR
jgi:hypothetical protein